MAKEIEVRLKRILYWTAALTSAAVTCVGLYSWNTRHNDTPASLPDSVLQAVNFPVYYYKAYPPADFQLDNTSLRYESGVLIFRLTNSVKNQTVVVTEQSLPPELANSTAQGDTEVQDAYGSASVSFREGRTTGTLIGKGFDTLVTINSSDAGTDTMKDILRELRPVDSGTD